MRIDAVVATGTAAAAVIGPDMTVAYVGVPVNVLFACAAGTYAAFAFNKEKVEPRSRMAGMFIACMFMGGAFTSVVKAVVEFLTEGKFGMESGVLAACGGIVSFVTFYLLPTLAEIIRSKEWVNWIPFLNRKDQ